MNQELLIKTLLAPHISEKSTRTAENHKQFVFEVPCLVSVVVAAEDEATARSGVEDVMELVDVSPDAVRGYSDSNQTAEVSQMVVQRQARPELVMIDGEAV